MKIKFIFLMLILLFNSNLLSNSLNMQKEFKKIECKLVPIEIKKEKFKSRANSNSNTSRNWSGYIAATNLNNPQSNSVKGVYGSWTVPTLRPSSHSFCTIWVGIDGFKSSTIEQIGTAHEWINGNQVNYAWFAMNPNSSFRISNFVVNNNDSISASVLYIGNNVFSLSIINNTTQQFSTVPLSLTQMANTLRNTAEWIVESNDLLPFAKFDIIHFKNCHTIINDVDGNINNVLWQNTPITMVLRSNVAAQDNGASRKQEKAVPLNLKANGRSFKVKWMHE